MAEEKEMKKARVRSAKAVSESDQQQKKKKKKHALDHPHSDGLSTSDAKIPVIEPNVRSEDATKCSNQKAASAPMQEPPPTELLLLVEAFLTSFGFESTCRIYTREWKDKAKTLGNEYKLRDAGTKKSLKDMPSLLHIYTQWRRNWVAPKPVDSSGAPEHTGDAHIANKTARDQSLDDSRASSDSDAMPLGEQHASSPAKVEQAKVSKSKGSGTVRSSKKDRAVLSDRFDNAASNDRRKLPMGEEPKPGFNSERVGKSKTMALSAPSGPDEKSDDDNSIKASGQSTKNGATNKAPSSLKRKASPPERPVSFTVREEQPVESSIERPKKKKKKSKDTNGTKTDTKSVEKSQKKNEKGREKPGSEDIAPAPANSEITAPVMIETNPLSRPIVSHQPTYADALPSNGAPNGDSNDVGAGSPTEAEETPSRFERSTKKSNIPFQRIPLDIRIDPRHASNAYVPNDYADRAHRDLSVTKGRGFTKEKNKKKRGS